jgi:hypothetical protein
MTDGKDGRAGQTIADQSVHVDLGLLIERSPIRRMTAR